jgi:hypothetical protein
MTTQSPQSNPPPLNAPYAASDEVARVTIFIWLQLFFLVVSIFTGGFHYKLWSMLDSALLIQSIGITGLVLVLDQPRLRRFAFMTAIILYLLGLLDMGINVLVSGVVGWHAISP